MGTRIPTIQDDPALLKRRMQTYRKLGFDTPGANQKAMGDLEALSPYTSGAGRSFDPEAELESAIRTIQAQKTPATAKVDSLKKLMQNYVNTQGSKTSVPTSFSDYELLKSYVEDSPLEARTSTVAGMADQMEAVEDIRAQKEDPDLNLAPLMNLADTWFGSNLSEGYQPPLNKDQLAEIERELQSGLNRQQWGLYGRDIDLINALKNQGQITYGSEQGKQDTQQIAPSITIKNPPAAAAKTKGKSVDETALADKLLKSTGAKTIGGIISFNSALDGYIALVDKLGLSPIGADKDTLDAAYSDLKTSFKEAKNLGALAGPDLGILLESMKPATSITGYVGSKFGFTGGVKGIKNAAKVIKENAIQDYSLNKSNVQKAFGGYGRTDQILNDWDRRARSLGVIKAKPQGPKEPPVGTIQGGYRYKGGGAGNKANWEKVD